ncbi:hypothetical protein ACA910_000329 [Epithemia clementina (nom. ined.)]
MRCCGQRRRMLLFGSVLVGIFIRPCQFNAMTKSHAVDRNINDVYAVEAKPEEKQHQNNEPSKRSSDAFTVPPPSSRISFTLYRNRPYKNQFNPEMNCNARNNVRKGIRRAPLPEAMLSPGVLDFTTYWSTDLKILVMGDSVALQLSETLEEVAQVNPVHRTVLRESWKKHNGLHVSAPVEGGGVIAGWRILHFLLSKNRGQPLPNKCCGGWILQDVKRLLNHPITTTTTSKTINKLNSTKLKTVRTTVQSFDVMVFRISHGWHGLDDVTKPNIYETLQLAHSLFGVKTVIFLSLPFVNNIQTNDDLTRLYEKRRLLHSVAQRWTDLQALKRQANPKSKVDAVQTVLVLDFAKLTDELIERNAQLLGMNISDKPGYLLESNGVWARDSRYTHHTAQVCGAPPNKIPATNIYQNTEGNQRMSSNKSSNPKNQTPSPCIFNSISKDGMHWCFETIGGRVFAGLACQLACVYPKQRYSSQSDLVRSSSSISNNSNGNNCNHMPSTVGECAQACNDKYMSLNPISKEEILD